MLESIAQRDGFSLAALTAVVVGPILFYYLYDEFVRDPPYNVPKYTTTAQNPGESKFDSLDDIMKENYRKDKNHIYKVEHPHKDVVIMPAKYVDELKGMSDDQVNFLEDINERFLGEYTKMLAPGGLQDETVTDAIKNSLTPNLGNIMTELQEEIAYAFSKEVGECEEWTPLYPMTTLMRIIALVSGRIFAGPDLNRDEEYINACLNFAVEGYNVIPALRPYPKFLRPVAQYWVKECRGPEKSIATMQKLITPILTARIKSGDKPHDMMTWIMDNSPPGKATDLHWQAMYQLQVATAAMHTTSNTMTHIWFDLAAHPELLPILREEILAVTASEPSGILSKYSMPKLKKLDSFIKESQRMNPFSSTGFSRRIMRQTRLKDGTIFPAGITVTVPVSQISMDPTIYPNPEEFDALRFYKLREMPGNESKYQYVTTSKDSLNWGHGAHACPGRFFASNEIKVIMIHLVMNYEIGLEGKERPKNIWTEGGMVPDSKGKILLKKR